MRKTYTFEKAFGPVTPFSGYIIFVVGLVATYSSYIGIFFVLLGAFIGFTNSCTTIDFTNRKARFSNHIFGIIKLGKWLDIDDNMSVGLKKSNKTYRTYSRSNRIHDISVKQVKIYLFDSNGNSIMPLKNVDTINSSDKEIVDLSKKLGLTTLKK